MFMPRVSYNRGIFDCFSSGIYLELLVTEVDRCLCLGLKSTKAISLLRVKKKSSYCSSSSHEQQQCFSLPFLNASSVAKRQCSFVGVSLQHAKVPSSLHHRPIVAQASSIVVFVRGCKVAIVVVISRFWYVLLLFLIMKPSILLNM